MKTANYKKNQHGEKKTMEFFTKNMIDNSFRITWIIILALMILGAPLLLGLIIILTILATWTTGRLDA